MGGVVRGERGEARGEAGRGRLTSGCAQHCYGDRTPERRGSPGLPPPAGSSSPPSVLLPPPPRASLLPPVPASRLGPLDARRPLSPGVPPLPAAPGRDGGQPGGTGVSAGRGTGRWRPGAGGARQVPEGNRLIGDPARVLPPPHPVFPPANSGSERPLVWPGEEDACVTQCIFKGCSQDEGSRGRVLEAAGVRGGGHAGAACGIQGVGVGGQGPRRMHLPPIYRCLLLGHKLTLVWGTHTVFTHTSQFLTWRAHTAPAVSPFQ